MSSRSPFAKLESFRKLCRDTTHAIVRFKMIQPHDRLLVGISGGEDSLTLMHILSELQRRSPVPFELIPATVDLGFNTFKADVLDDYCRQFNWQLHYAKLDGATLLKEKNAEDRPCALCSRLRRGQLHALADQLQCNKLVLGQQLDDLCVSLLIALFRGGGLKTMGPNVPADAASKRLIRPLCLIAKSRIHQFADIAQYPKIKSCPYEQQLQENGDRAFVEQLLKNLESRFPDIKSAMLHGMGDVRLAHLLDERYLQLDAPADDPDAGKL